MPTSGLTVPTKLEGRAAMSDTLGLHSWVTACSSWTGIVYLQIQLVMMSWEVASLLDEQKAVLVMTSQRDLCPGSRAILYDVRLTK